MLRFAWQNLITRPTRTILAVSGLTIPILAILGLFSLTNGIRALMGNTLARMNGLMIMSENSPAPVFSDLPAAMGDEFKKIKGTRMVAPEIWKICPQLEGRNLLARAATRMFTGRGDQKFSSFAETIMIEGQSLPEHLNLKSGVYEQGILPREKGGGRFLRLEDIGQPRVLISTKIARDYPGADGKPKQVGETLHIGGKPFEIIGIYETGSFLVDMTVVMEITTARKLLGIGEETVSTFYIEPDHVTDLNLLSERIRQQIEGVQVKSMSQFNVQVGNIMGRLDLFLLLTVSLALLVGAVGIANTMLTSAMERIVEFGVMRANGWTRRDVLGLVTVESALLGLLSGVLAVLAAGGAVAFVNMLLAKLELRLELSFVLVAGSVAAAVAIAVAAGLYPAWRASRMTPMDAIRNGAS